MSIAGRGISRPLSGRSHAWARCSRSMLSVKGNQNLAAPLSELNGVEQNAK
jgi:hypothetical protein